LIAHLLEIEVPIAAGHPSGQELAFLVRDNLEPSVGLGKEELDPDPLEGLVVLIEDQAVDPAFALVILGGERPRRQGDA
jgi:hypothetical protein